MGTSLTALYDWPDQVADELAACLGRDVDLSVIARPGAQSPWGVAQLDRVADSAPEIVIVEMAINDADVRDGIWLRDSRAAHGDIVTGLQAMTPTPQIVLMTMSPAQGLRGWLRFRLGRYYGVTVELAAERGIGLLDMYPRWMALARGDRGLQGDGLHPEAAVADPFITRALTAYLGASRGVSCGR